MSNLKHLSPKPGVNLIAVEVPEGAYNIQLHNKSGFWVIAYSKDDGAYLQNIKFSIKEKLTQLGIATELPEEVVRELVDSVDCCDEEGNLWGYLYQNHEKGEEVNKRYYSLDTAAESFHSFLRVHGLDKGRWLVMEVK